MGLTLGSIVVATLLVANALAILHEERFLSKWGWGYEQTRMDPTSIKAQISRLLYAFRVIMRGKTHTYPPSSTGDYIL